MNDPYADEWDRMPESSRALLRAICDYVRDDSNDNFARFLYTLPRADVNIPITIFDAVAYNLPARSQPEESGYVRTGDGKVWVPCFTHVQAHDRWREPDSCLWVHINQTFWIVERTDADGLAINPADPVFWYVPRAITDLMLSEARREQQGLPLEIDKVRRRGNFVMRRYPYPWDPDIPRRRRRWHVRRSTICRVQPKY